MTSSIPSNAVLDKLPKHLSQYIHPQHYDQYTAIDQAVWRYVMRRNVDYLSSVAHSSYISGLDKTGISIDKIPDMYGMNRILKDLGWAAVAVDGFIPPAAFMEFQAYNVLVIASDIRKLDNIKYTPAPDIIHEAAGHAPIIANPEYAEYLRRFGEIGSRAISSSHDWDMYEAVRLVSQLKEKTNVNAEELKQAEEKLDELQNKEVALSEMSMIRNLHWWTVEYGLIGTLDNFQIYGAGLLSSIGESKWCMDSDVTKINYTIEAATQSFDITKPQPQLYVTPDFSHLSKVLEEFANNMAVRKGGMKGIQQLMDSKNVGTIELSTGLQISGVFDHVITTKNNKVAFFQTVGPTSLSHENKELIGHDTAKFADGYGSPIGRLKGINLAIEDMSPRDLEAYNIYEGKIANLEFMGDIKLTGKVITGTRNLKGKILLISFQNCTVMHKREILFRSKPDQLYHMAVGKKISSAFAGPADCHSFPFEEHQISETQSIPMTAQQEDLNRLYSQIMKIRDHQLSTENIFEIHATLKNNHPSDWLSQLQLLELAKAENNSTLQNSIIDHLDTLCQLSDHNSDLIKEGLRMIN